MNEERVSASDWRHWAEGFQQGWDRAAAFNSPPKRPPVSGTDGRCTSLERPPWTDDTQVVVRCELPSGHGGYHIGDKGDWSWAEEP